MRKEPLTHLLTGKDEIPLTPLKRLGDTSLKGYRVPYPGMDKVVGFVKTWIEHYRGEQFVRDLALQITRKIVKNSRTGHPDMRNFDALAKAIHDWIVRNIVYTRDNHGIERLQTPDATILLKSGDCDDMVTLGGSLLESLGVPTRIKLIGQQVGSFTHIYLEYQNQYGEWKSFDPTLALYPGFKFPTSTIKAEKQVAISSGGLSDYAGFNKTKKTMKSQFVSTKTEDSELGVVVTAASVAGAVSVAKSLGISFGKKKCSGAQKEARDQLSSLITKYLTYAEMQKLVAMADSSIKPTGSDMAYFFFGGNDCKHKNVSAGDQRFLDELESVLTQKEIQSMQGGTANTSAPVNASVSTSGNATSGGSDMMKYAGIGGGALVLLGGAFWAFSGRTRKQAAGA